MCSEFDKDSGQLVRLFGGYVSFAGERSQILSVQRGFRYVWRDIYWYRCLWSILDKFLREAITFAFEKL